MTQFDFDGIYALASTRMDADQACLAVMDAWAIVVLDGPMSITMWGPEPASTVDLDMDRLAWMSRPDWQQMLDQAIHAGDLDEVTRIRNTHRGIFGPARDITNTDRDPALVLN